MTTRRLSASTPPCSRVSSFRGRLTWRPSTDEAYPARQLLRRDLPPRRRPLALRDQRVRSREVPGHAWIAGEAPLRPRVRDRLLDRRPDAPTGRPLRRPAVGGHLAAGPRPGIRAQR